jgi:5,10-methylenetetrahydrofolate reductase
MECEVMADEEHFSRLHSILNSGKFAVTGEIGPPKGADPEKIVKKGEMVRGYGDAFNITDNQTATVRLSSIASGVVLRDMGLEPIIQMTCRDRNRIGLQSDLLGIGALGLSNVVCMTGDHQSFGNHPESLGVFDLDSVHLIRAARQLRDGMFMNGEDLKAAPPTYYIGAVENPFATPAEYRLKRLEKKVDAGAEFVQTQAIFNVDKFEKWMADLRKEGLDQRVHVIAGVSPPKSLRIAQRMKDIIPGVDMPDKIMDRLASAEDFQAESLEVSSELVERIIAIEGVHGVHLMPIFWESLIPELVKMTGLYPRPEP